MVVGGGEGSQRGDSKESGFICECRCSSGEVLVVVVYVLAVAEAAAAVMVVARLSGGVKGCW